jgi:hypothetical protein
MRRYIMLLLVLIVTNISGQTQDEYRISLKSRVFIPAVSSRAEIENIRSKNILLQFSESLNRERVEQLRNAGVVIHGQVSSYTLSLLVEDKNMLSGIAGIRWGGGLEPYDKTSSKLYEMEDEFYFIVNFHYALNAADYIESVKAAGGILVHGIYPGGNDLLVKGDKALVDRLAELDPVAFIYPASQKLINGEQLHKCPGPLGAFGYLPMFVTQGNGWDGPGLNSVNLKYHFVNGTPDVVGEHAEVVAALETWGKYAQINWSSTNLPNQNKSIDIIWGSLDHGCGFPFDGPSGVLGHCFYPDDSNPETIAGDMHFDEDEFWQIGKDIDVFTVALHEAGHGLGLNHSDDPDAVMFPFYNEPVADLRPDDINGIRALYAARNTSRTSPPVFQPAAGTYPSPLEIKLDYGSGSTAQNTRIYYTLNGSEPTPYSYEFVPGSDYIFQRYSNTIKARAFRLGHTPSTVVTASYILQQSNLTVENPVITPNGGTFNGSVQVSISSPSAQSTVRYTTNGSEPTQSSTAYTSPLTISSPTVLKAKAFKTNYTPSQTVTANFAFNTQLQPPVAHPQPGVYSTPVAVQLSSPVSGAMIYYTTDGNIPTTSSNLYTSPVQISQTILLKAVTFLNNSTSDIFSGWYNLNVSSTSPVINPNGGQFTGSVAITLSTTTPGGIIRYTTNGAEPTAFSTVYSAPFNLGVGQHTVKAKTYHQSLSPSTTSTALFVVYEGSAVKVADPVITPFSTQTFTTAIPVTITCATEGALIRYTVGFDALPPDPQPTGGGSITYTGKFNIGSPGQNIFIKVRAYKEGLTQSNIIQTGMLSVVTPSGTVAAPSITPEGGVFHNNVQVTLATVTAFAQILYTRDGSEPDSFLPILLPTSVYNAPFTLSRSTVIRAKGTRTFFSDSNVSEAEFILKCGTPVINPDTGTFPESVQLTMTGITSNASIRYTLDGSEPSNTSLLYSGPFVLLPGSYVLKAKAFRANYENSETAVAQIEVTEPAVIPSILSHPADVQVDEGETAVFTVEVSGTPLPGIQWLRNSVILPGETSGSLVLENIQIGDAGEYRAKVFNSAGEVFSNTALLRVNSTTSVNEYRLAGIPDDYELKGNYPNPFNPSTIISFGIPEESKVVVNIFNIMGELVEVLLNGLRPAGFYERKWDASGYASGMYLLKITSESVSGNRSFSKIHKLILIK